MVKMVKDGETVEDGESGENGEVGGTVESGKIGENWCKWVKLVKIAVRWIHCT